MKIKQKFMLPIGIQILVLLSTFYFIMESKVLFKEVQQKRSSANQIFYGMQELIRAISDFYRKAATAADVEKQFEQVVTLLKVERAEGETTVMQRLLALKTDFEKIPARFQENSGIITQIMDLTDLSIQQSNQFIKETASNLADEKLADSVTKLERLVLIGANTNTSSNFRVKVLVYEMIADFSKKQQLLDYLELLLKNVRRDEKDLAGTPFAALAKTAREANEKINDLVRQYVANLEKLTGYQKSAQEQLKHFLTQFNEQEAQYIGASFNELTRAFTTLGVVLLALSLVFIGLNLTLARSILRYLTQALAITRRIAQGDFTISMGRVTKDEIGVLMTELSNMVANLNALIGQIHRSGFQVTTSSTELAAMSKQQEVTVKTQVQAANQVLQSMGEIAAVTEHLVQTMQGVAAMSADAAAAKDGQQTDLDRMAGAMQQMETASRMISGRLQTINDKADNITKIVTTITKVADQTNLLSLNAAIEAEKAGEYGRGFTVVAREIRRLADQTAVATLDIEQMVREMQAAVTSGVMEMDKFIAEVRRSAEDVRMIGTKLFQIIKQVQALSPRFDEANRSMLDLSEGMQQTSESLSETFLAIGQLNEAAKGLQDEVNRFRVN